MVVKSAQQVIIAQLLAMQTTKTRQITFLVHVILTLACQVLTDLVQEVKLLLTVHHAQLDITVLTMPQLSIPSVMKVGIVKLTQRPLDYLQRLDQDQMVNSVQLDITALKEINLSAKLASIRIS